MTDYATVQDVEALWGQDIPADSALFTQVTALLNGAHAVVRARVHALDDRVAAGTVLADVVKYVMTELVVGVLRNPQGLKMEIAGIFQRQIDTTQASARMSLSESQLDMLGEQRSAFTIELQDDATRTAGCYW